MKIISLLVFTFILGFSNSIATTINIVKTTSNTKNIRNFTSIKSVTKVSLRNNTKEDNIDNLLDMAEKEGKISLIDRIKLQSKYKNLKTGDEDLLHCLQHPKCDIKDFNKLLSSNGIENNELHKKLAYNYPYLNSTQIIKKSGDITENMMNSYFRSSGWTKLEGEIGNKGIDGLFIKRNKKGEIIDVLVVESKYNKSSLMNRNSGKQMSKTWIIDNISKLEKQYPDNKSYKEIKILIEKDQYRARLWKMNLVDNKLYIQTQKVESNNSNIKLINLVGNEKTKVEYQGNQTIDLSNPKNNFHKNIIETFQNSIINIKKEQL